LKTAVFTAGLGDTALYYQVEFMGDHQIPHPQDVSDGKTAGNVWTAEVQAQLSAQQNSAQKTQLQPGESGKTGKKNAPNDTPEKLYEKWYRAITTGKNSFEDTLALAESYCTKYGDAKYFHNDKELRAVKDWLKAQNDRPCLELDLSEYKHNHKNPTPEQIGLAVAKTLGFDDSEIALYASESGSKTPGAAFYKSSGDDGGYFLKEAQKDPLGRVKVGELAQGAIAGMKKWLADHKERLLPNPILKYNWDEQRTTTEAIEIHLLNPTANFAGGVAGGVGDLVRGVGLPLHLFSSHTPLDSAADGLKSASEYLDFSDLYTTKERQDVSFALMNMYFRGIGGAAPVMFSAGITKGLGVAGEVSEGLAEADAVAQAAIKANKVRELTGEVIGAAQNGGQIYDSALETQARKIAMDEFKNKDASEKEIADRIQEIKEGKNIDTATRQAIENKSLESALAAVPLGALYGRFQANLTASATEGIAENIFLAATKEGTKGSIIAVAQTITNEEAQAAAGVKSQNDAVDAISQQLPGAVFNAFSLTYTMAPIHNRTVEHIEPVTGLPEKPLIDFRLTEKPEVEHGTPDVEHETTNRGNKTDPEVLMASGEGHAPAERLKPPHYSDDMWDAYQRMEFDSTFRPTGTDYANAFSRLHDNGTVIEKVDVPKPGATGPFLDADGKASYKVYKEKGLEQRDETFRVYAIDGHDTKIYIPESYAKQLDALHASQGTDPSSYNHDRLLSPEQVVLALERLPDSTTVKKIYLFNTPCADDPYEAQIKNSPGFKSSATAGPDGVVTFYEGNSHWSTVSTNLSHEWVHEFGNAHPDYESVFDSATSLEQGLADKHNVPLTNYRPYAEFPRENMSVHIGEVGLHPDPDNLSIFQSSAPVRGYVTAEILRKALDEVPPERRSPFHQQYIERAIYLENQCLQPTIKKLQEALSDDNVNLRADAFNTIVGLNKPELLPLIAGIDYTKEPSGVGLRGAFAIKETIEKIPAEKRTEEHTRMLQQADKLHEDSVTRRIQELGPELNDPNAFKQMIALNTLVTLDSPQATRAIIAKGQSSELDQVFTVALRAVDQVYKDDPLARANAYKEIIEPHIERSSSQLPNAAMNVNVLEDALHSVYENDGKGVNDNLAVKPALDVIEALKPKVTEATKAQFANELSKGDVASDLKALSRIGQIGSSQYSELVVSTAQRSDDKSVIHLSLDVLKRMQWADSEAQAASFKAIADKNPKAVIDAMASLYQIFNLDASRAYFQIAAEHNVPISWAEVPTMASIGSTPEERNELWALATKALSPTEKYAFQLWKSADWPDHFVDIHDQSQLRKIIGWDRSNKPIFEDSGVKTEDASERDRAIPSNPTDKQVNEQVNNLTAEQIQALQLQRTLQFELEKWRTSHGGTPFDGTASPILKGESVDELVAGLSPSVGRWNEDTKPAKDFAEATAKLDIERAKEKQWTAKVEQALEPERENLGIPKDRLFLSELYDNYLETHPDVQREWSEIGERKSEPYARKNELIAEAQNRLDTLQPFFDDFCDKHDLPHIKLKVDPYGEDINGQVKSGRLDVTVSAAAVLGGRSPRESLAIITHEFMHAEQEYLIARMRMDKIGVGIQITSEQMQQVRETYGTNAQFVRDDFLQKVAEKRNGRRLTDAETNRARVIEASENYWAKAQGSSYQDITSLDEFVQLSKGKSAQDIERSIIALKQSHPKDYSSLFGSGHANNLATALIENPELDPKLLKTKLTEIFDARQQEVYLDARQRRFDYEALPHETEAFVMHTRVGNRMPIQNAAVPSDLDGAMKRLFGVEFTLVDHMEPIGNAQSSHWVNLSSQIFGVTP